MVTNGMAVLVAYDGSDPAQNALLHAARTYPDEEIILLRVAEAAGGSLGAGVDLVKEKLKELREETAKELSDDVTELLEDDDVEFRMEMVAGKPAREIVEYAEEHDIGVIVVGCHGRKGASRVLLGSVADEVARRSPSTVTIVR